MQTQPSIFKTYDIRGIYGQDFDETLAYDLGLAYTNWRSQELSTNNLSVVIGHDMRLSSPELHQALSRGLVDGGAEVIDIGLCATPSFYFAVANERADGGRGADCAVHGPGGRGRLFAGARGLSAAAQLQPPGGRGLGPGRVHLFPKRHYAGL